MNTGNVEQNAFIKSNIYFFYFYSMPYYYTTVNNMRKTR